MTNFNDKFIPNIPKTFQVLELRDQQQEQQQPVKKSPLSPAARAKVINRSGSNYLSKNEGYGSCSYSYCNHRNKSFDMDISIEGYKWWARNPSYGTSLPGCWTESPTGSYYWRENLWLNHMGHAQDADSLIGANNLYTVNTVGAYAMEDYDFCVGTQNLIWECVRLHEQGYSIDETRTLPSSTTGFTKWCIKVVGSAAVGAAFGPGGAAGAYLASEASKVAGIETNASRFLGGVGGNVVEIASDAASGIAEEFGGSLPGLGFISMTKDMLKHNEHINEGRRYDSDCPMCK